MSSWNELLAEQQEFAEDEEAAFRWLWSSLDKSLRDIEQLRGDRNVILYGSAFLQKPSVPSEMTMITHEDVNGLMSAVRGLDCAKGLTLVLHTPGGVTTAAETIVKYLRSKFDDIEVIVPFMAMSAGTMISLASDRVVMGRQSQLGPIDPQLQSGGRSISAQAVDSLFKQAEKAIKKNKQEARLWAPITQSMGPSLLQDARDSLSYSNAIVGKWLDTYMFADAKKKPGKKIAAAFSNTSGKLKNQHGRRIDIDEARRRGVIVEELELSQPLQDAVMRAYHLMTIAFDQTVICKMVFRDSQVNWNKSWTGPIPQQ